MEGIEVEEIDGELEQVVMVKNEVIQEVEVEVIVENVMDERIVEVIVVVIPVVVVQWIIVRKLLEKVIGVAKDDLLVISLQDNDI